MLTLFLLFSNNHCSVERNNKEEEQKENLLKWIISCISVRIVLFFHKYSDISRRKLFKLIIDIRATNIQPIIRSFLK